MSIKQKLINERAFVDCICRKYYNDLTQEDVDYIVEKYSWVAAKHLNQHPLLTQEDVDLIVKEEPCAAAKYLSHKLPEKNIGYIANNHPQYLKAIFR